MAVWALARWLSWLEDRPIHQKVVGLIPSQGKFPLFPSPSLPSPSLPLLLSIKVNKYILGSGLKKLWHIGFKK